MDEKNMSINEETIEKNRRWFDFFEYFPMMFSVILAVVMFFAGMVMFFLEIEPFIPLILWIVGGVVCYIIYAVLKMLFSYRVLHIYYLDEILAYNKKIYKKTCSEKLEKVEKTEQN